MSIENSRKAAPELLTEPLTVTLDAFNLGDLNAYRQAVHAEQWPPKGLTGTQPTEYRETQRSKALRAAIALAESLSELAGAPSRQSSAATLQQGAHDQIKRLLKDADRLNFWQAHHWYSGERTPDGKWRFFDAESIGNSCKGANLREALDELQKIQPDLRGEMDDADAWEG